MAPGANPRLIEMDAGLLRGRSTLMRASLFSKFHASMSMAYVKSLLDCDPMIMALRATQIVGPFPAIFIATSEGKRPYHIGHRYFRPLTRLRPTVACYRGQSKRVKSTHSPVRSCMKNSHACPSPFFLKGDICPRVCFSCTEIGLMYVFHLLMPRYFMW